MLVLRQRAAWRPSLPRTTAAAAVACRRPRCLRPRVNGPIIPERFQFGSNLTQDGYMLLCAYSGYTTYEQFGVQPITAGGCGAGGLCVVRSAVLRGVAM